jgi:hypothetical protein
MRFVAYVDAGPDLRRVTAAEALELLERATSAPVWAQTQKEAEAFARRLSPGRMGGREVRPP